jgi:molecular chaperone DnaJ
LKGFLDGCTPHENNRRRLTNCCVFFVWYTWWCVFESIHSKKTQDDTKAADKFREITEAYEVLSDDKQREVYNQFGHAGVDPNFQQAGGGGNPFGAGGFNFQDGSFHFSSSSGGNPEIDPEELFDMFFGSGGGGGGRGRRSRGPRRGADLQMHVRLSFQEAVFGAKKDLNLRYQHVNRKTGDVSVKEREVQVDVPAGVDNGMNLRLQGQGAEGDPGAQPGNLLVQLIVDADEFFERDGYDVHCEVPISFTQAVLGGMVDVKTLESTVEMKIPKGCQPDTKLMLRGKGIKQLHGSTKGNQIVHLKIVIPKEITTRQEELLREFDEETKKCGNGIFGNLSAAAGSAFEKLFGPKTNKPADTKKEASSTGSSNSSAEDSEDDEKKQAAS